MQNVYDKLKDFASILGDHSTDEAEKYRNLMRGQVITGTDHNHRPTYSKIPYLLRSVVYVDPDTAVSKHGSFSMALPAVIEKQGNKVLVKVLSDGGVKEAKLKGIEDWQLPSGGKGNLPDGQGGVLVAGTEIDSNKKIFIPSGGGGKGGGFDLIAAHRNKDATDGSSTVSDLTADGGMGLQALLSEAFWVTKRPAKVDAELRNAVAINSFSAGVRSGKFLEHQGGAIVLFNSNIRSLESGTQPPKVTSWSAWLDDGPYFEGEGAKDMHLKGIDSEGTPHLPLMFRKERAKFGPGPQRKPSAPFDFLEAFASIPAYSQRIYRAEIKYDRALKHPNPSGIYKQVEGRWVVEYRLPHKTPVDDPERTKTPVKDPQRKSPIDDPSVGKEDEDTQDKSPRTVDPVEDKDPSDPKQEFPQFPGTGEPPDGPGPGGSGGGPGTCGHPGEGPREPGPGTGNGDGPGSETGPADSVDSQDKHDSAIKKKREADNGVQGSVTSNVQHPETQTNLNSVSFNSSPLSRNTVLNKPMWSHIQTGYPSIVGVIPSVETGGLTQRGTLSHAEERAVDDWPFTSTQIIAFGNVNNPAQNLRIDKDRKTVLGGFLIAGANLTSPQVYDSNVDGLEATLAVRPEASIKFGFPDISGNISEQSDSQGFVHSVGEIKALFDRLVLSKHKGLLTDIEYDHVIEFFNTVLFTPQTTAQRPATSTQGMGRFNSDTKALEIYDGTTWQKIIGHLGMGFPILAPNGDVLSPSYSFNSSSVAGIFYDPAGANPDRISFNAADGTTIFYIDAVGMTIDNELNAIGTLNSDTGIISSILTFGAQTTSGGGAGSTRYLFPGGGTKSAQSRVQEMRAPKNGTLRNLYIKVGNPRGNGNDVVYTVRVNGVDTAIEVTMVGNADNDGEDTTNQVTIVEGDDIAIVITKPDGNIGTNPRDISALLELV